MGKIGKTFALILVLIMAISGVGLLAVKPASAQPTTTPSPISTQPSTGPSLSVTNALIVIAILLAVIIALVLRHRKNR